MDAAAIERVVIETLRSALALDGAAPLARDTALLGAMPELDSLSLVRLLTALEAELDIHVEDDEVDAAIFATVGTLCDFVAAKRAAAKGADWKPSS